MKAWLSRILYPAAWISARLAPFGRVWAHACLAARIRTRLDPSVVLLGPAEVQGTGRISFGRNLYLYRDLYFETSGAGEIEIGDNVVVSRGVHIVAYGKITIGSGSMIGEYSSIRDANHHFGSDVAIRVSGHIADPIEIGRNVWIGRGVAILPGTSIGDGAVVGANAVVTNDVPRGAVVAGVPARALVERLTR